MDEELEMLWQKLQLTEEEEEGVSVTKEMFFEGMPWVPHCLLVSLLTKKHYNREAFKGTMERIWKSTPLRKVTEVGENLFIFQFHTEEDREIIINSGPWNFNDRMVLTKPLEKEDQPGKEILTKACIWTQIYGLPFVAMTEKMGCLIGEKLGRVIEVKTDEEGKGLGACLAVRIEIDVRKQLKRRLKVAIEEDQVVFVDFKYERLPAFCYCCGVIGHNDIDCGAAIKKKREGAANPIQYGKWIRAPARQKAARSNSNNGGKGSHPNQFWAIKNLEKWSSREGGTEEGEGEVVAEEARDKTVKSIPIGAEREITKRGIDFQNQADEAHGKEKEALTEELIIQLSNEEKSLTLEEMVWQKTGEQVTLSKKGIEGHNNKELGQEDLGRVEVQHPMSKAIQNPMADPNQATNEGRIHSSGYECSNGKGGTQSRWKRKAREEGGAKENKEQLTPKKLGKRGMAEGEMSKKEEEQGKRRKVLGKSQTILWRWLMNNPAVINDCPMLELPGTWEPPGSKSSEGAY